MLYNVKQFKDLVKNTIEFNTIPLHVPVQVEYDVFSEDFNREIVFTHSISIYNLIYSLYKLDGTISIEYAENIWDILDFYYNIKESYLKNKKLEGELYSITDIYKFGLSMSVLGAHPLFESAIINPNSNYSCYLYIYMGNNNISYLLRKHNNKVIVFLYGIDSILYNDIMNTLDYDISNKINRAITVIRNDILTKYKIYITTDEYFYETEVRFHIPLNIGQFDEFYITLPYKDSSEADYVFDILLNGLNKMNLSHKISHTFYMHHNIPILYDRILVSSTYDNEQLYNITKNIDPGDKCNYRYAPCYKARILRTSLRKMIIFGVFVSEDILSRIFYSSDYFINNLHKLIKKYKDKMSSATYNMFTYLIENFYDYVKNVLLLETL